MIENPKQYKYYILHLAVVFYSIIKEEQIWSLSHRLKMKLLHRALPLGACRISVALTVHSALFCCLFFFFCVFLTFCICSVFAVFVFFIYTTFQSLCCFAVSCVFDIASLLKPQFVSPNENVLGCCSMFDLVSL